MPSGYYEFYKDNADFGSWIYREATLTNLDLSYSGSELYYRFDSSDNYYVPTQLKLDFRYTHDDVYGFDGYVELYYGARLIGSVFCPYSVAGTISRTFELDMFDIADMQDRKHRLNFPFSSDLDDLSLRFNNQYFQLRFFNYGTEEARVTIDDLSLSYVADNFPTYQNHETLINPRLVEGHFGTIEGTVIGSGSPYRFVEDDTVKVNFSGFENPGFEKVGKATVRINASNTNTGGFYDPNAKTRLEVFGYNRHINKDTDEYYRIFAWGQSEPVVNSGFQSYDIELSFINGGLRNASGFAAYKQDRDWLSLFTEGDFYIQGCISGLEISDGSIYLEDYNDEYLPLHALGGKGLFNGALTVYPSGQATGFNLLKEDVNLDYYFNNEYFGFNNLSTLSRDGSNRIAEVEYDGTPGYGTVGAEVTPTVQNYFSSNLDRTYYAENNLVKTRNDTALQVVSGLDLSGDYSLVLQAFINRDVGGEIFHNHQYILEADGTNITWKVKNALDGYATLSFPEKDDYEVSVLVQRSGNEFKVYSFNSGLELEGTLTATPYGTPDSGVLLFPNDKGTLSQLGFSTSGWSETDRNSYFRQVYSFEEKLNDSGYVSVEIPTSSGLNTIPFNIYSDVPLEGREEFFYQLNLPHRVDFYSVDNNVSGFYLDIETSSPIDLTYSGHFRYGSNGFLSFVGPISSGNNIDTKIYATDSYYEKFDRSSIDFYLHSNFLINQEAPYSGTVKLHNTSMGFDTWSAPVETTSGIDLFLMTANPSSESLDLFVNGWSSLASGIDLYTYGAYLDTKSLDLTTKGRSVYNQSVDFYVLNILKEVRTLNFSMSGHPYTEEKDISLYTFGSYLAESGVDLYTYGIHTEATELNFYVAGLSGIETSSGIDFYSTGSAAANTTQDIDFHLYSNLDRDSSINMFIAGDTETETASINMVLASDGLVNKSFDLYLENTRESTSESLDFYLDAAYTTETASINMYLPSSVEEDESAAVFGGVFGSVFGGAFGTSAVSLASGVDFTIKVNSLEASLVPFVTEGGLYERDSVDMYMSGVGRDNNSLDLFTHGF